jgi:hypothetical protein
MAALRRAATTRTIPPAISTNSPFTTFGTARTLKRSGKRCKRGSCPYAPAVAGCRDFKGLNANLQRYSSGMIKFIIIAITILLVLEEYFGGLSLSPFFSKKDKK